MTQTTPNSKENPFDEKYAAHIIEQMKSPGVQFSKGLMDSEVRRIEELHEAQMPPDLQLFWQLALPIHDARPGHNDAVPRWRESPEGTARKSREWVRGAFEFDIRNNNYWFDEFGPKPSEVNSAVAQAVEVVDSWPRMFRVYSHRFMPSKPRETGNPVVSLYQAIDSVIYGADLAWYLYNEFRVDAPDWDVPHVRTNPHWSRALGLE